MKASILPDILFFGSALATHVGTASFRYSYPPFAVKDVTYKVRTNLPVSSSIQMAYWLEAMPPRWKRKEISNRSPAGVSFASSLSFAYEVVQPCRQMPTATRAASRRCICSAVSFQSTAPRFCRSCSSELAPMTRLHTVGRCSNQFNATCATAFPVSAATSSNTSIILYRRS